MWLQVVPLQSILDFRESSSSQYLKTLAMSVYTQCRRQVTHTIMGRSLTGFGPASSADILLKGPIKEVWACVFSFGPIVQYMPLVCREILHKIVP